MRRTFLTPWIRVDLAIVRWTRDSRGQDLVEYALLTALVGLVAYAVLNGVGETLRDAYRAWNASAEALWEAPNPQ